MGDKEEHDIMEEIDGYNYQGIECYVLSEPLVTEQAPQSPMDVIFILDSSGSVAVDDDDFSNWQAEINFAAETIRHFLFDMYIQIGLESRIGLINFSGCGTSVTFAECQKQNKLKNELSLTSREEALAHLDSMGSDDFNFGHTWTDEALGMALAEFEANSSPDHSKLIVLLTDGEPSPPNQGHEPCKSSMNFQSETVAALHELGANIVTFGIKMNEDFMQEYFGCTDLFYPVDDFDFWADHVSEVATAILKAIGWTPQ